MSDMDGLYEIYESVGVAAGAADSGQELVGILFPQDPSGDCEECEAKWMTIAAAKALLIDLTSAIEACMEHKSNG